MNARFCSPIGVISAPVRLACIARVEVFDAEPFLLWRQCGALVERGPCIVDIHAGFGIRLTCREGIAIWRWVRGTIPQFF